MKDTKFGLRLDAGAVDAAADLLNLASRVAIICHVSPDGDAVGSSLGLRQVLLARGGYEDVTVVTPDQPPKTLMFLPGARDIVVATRSPEAARRVLERADVVVCLDFNAAMRVDRMEEALLASTAPRVLVDHHLCPSIEARAVLSHTEVSSTSALLYMILQAMGWGAWVNRAAAECLYVGMMTDTGNFSYNSNDPDLYLIIADMVRLGVNKDLLYQRVMNTSTAARVRICGYAQYRMDIERRHRCAVLVLTDDQLKEFDYAKGDTEMLVNVPLSLPEVTWSVFLRQDSPCFVKVSMRSRGQFPVNLVCERHFGGGGHRNAAGGEFHGTLTQALQTLKDAMPEFDQYL